MTENNEQHDDRYLDDLLDSALAQYAQAEPRPGLEGRLLARLRSEPKPASFAWRWLPVAAAATVVLAAALYFAGSRAPRPPEVAVQPQPVVAPQVTTPPTPELSAPVVNRAAGKQPSAAGASTRAAGARREQFFQPTPVSEQEAALVRLVNQTPQRDLLVLARQSRAESIPDLRVDALDIPPLVAGEADSQ